MFLKAIVCTKGFSFQDVYPHSLKWGWFNEANATWSQFGKFLGNKFDHIKCTSKVGQPWCATCVYNPHLPQNPNHHSLWRAIRRHKCSMCVMEEIQLGYVDQNMEIFTLFEGVHGG
jgi:hypothetical protein